MSLLQAALSAGGSFNRIISNPEIVDNTGATIPNPNFEIASYKTAEDFAEAVFREYGFKIVEMDLKKKTSLYGKTGIAAEVQAHFNYVTDRLKIIYPLFVEKVRGYFASGITSQDAIDKAFDEIDIIVKTIKKQADQSFPLKIVEDALAHAKLGIS